MVNTEHKRVKTIFTKRPALTRAFSFVRRFYADRDAGGDGYPLDYGVDGGDLDQREF